jgi:ATP-binding cassette subfamily B protein
LAAPAEILNQIPTTWRGRIASQLHAGEQLTGWFATDLDSRMHFGAELVVVTTHRLLTADESGQWHRWTHSEISRLIASEHGGVGKLELFGPDQRLRVWRYTLGKAQACHRLVQQFTAVRAGDTTGSLAGGICPSCGSLITSDDGICPTCSVSVAPPVMSSLMRIATFARNRRGILSLGFLLTLAATAAGLVWPYLTIPLFDRVLVPFTQGKGVGWSLFWMLIGAGAIAFAAEWLLDWAKTYVLAWAFERISADMRTRTYAHLQSLSLEFFGGRRTGDLISRVSSDTDRICNFLSLNAMSFGTDVLMICMSAAILVSINPLLALITLAPFPIILWLAYLVRDRLRHGFHQATVTWANMTSVLADTIPGIRVVKAFAQEHREIDRFRDANNRVLESNDRVNVWWAFFGPTVKYLNAMGLLIVWVAGALLIFRGQIQLGVLSAFVLYISRFYVCIE